MVTSQHNPPQKRTLFSPERFKTKISQKKEQLELFSPQEAKHMPNQSSILRTGYLFYTHVPYLERQSVNGCFVSFVVPCLPLDACIGSFYSYTLDGPCQTPTVHWRTMTQQAVKDAELNQLRQQLQQFQAGMSNRTNNNNNNNRRYNNSGRGNNNNNNQQEIKSQFT
jgi:hypothetical protein